MRPDRASSGKRRVVGGSAWLLTLLVAGVSTAGGSYAPSTNYVLHCQGCHGADGVGGTPGAVPPLADSVGWFLRVDGGREYLAQVPGAANAPITDRELAALLNYMIERFSLAEAGGRFEAYTADEVARVRHLRPDIVARRTALVAAIEAGFGARLWVERHDEPEAAYP